MNEETLRILLVDDDEIDRMAVSRALSAAGIDCTITEADNGTTALERYCASDFDCVLLDYRLPDVDGFELLEKFSEVREMPRAAVIMLTGENDVRVATEAMRLGAQDFIVKGSLAPATLRRSINNATEKMALMASIDLQRRELERSNEELERFAYVISHDLQEPLRLVTSFLQLLQKRYNADLDDKARQYISHAVSGASRMRDMIRSLLELSRIGKSKLTMDSADISEHLDAALENLQLAIEESGARVTRGEMPVISCDRNLVIQLFQNLLGNALKYRGDVVPEIHIEARPMTSEDSDAVHRTAVRHGIVWLFAVRDNGIGIDPKHFDQLFGIFQRLHTREEYPGTGVGLSICRKIVERHGGRIWLESKPGEGSTFYFTLPVVPDSMQKAA